MESLNRQHSLNTHTQKSHLEVSYHVKTHLARCRIKFKQSVSLQGKDGREKGEFR